ncbi:MAG: DUF899 domain-containing protein [Myxococcota bacterium]
MTTSNAPVSREQWLAARRALLKEEKALTLRLDALAEKRRALPPVEITAPYAFNEDGRALALRDLFGGRSQLLVYHFMYGPDWEEGCPSCSFWADGFDGMDVHLAARDIAFVVVSAAPWATLDAYRKRMGWRFRWVSSAGSTFNRDFGVSFSGEEIASGNADYNFAKKGFPSTEAPGASAFLCDGDRVLHTYSCYGRGLDILNGTYQWMDLAPRGRNEQDLPWPMARLRRRDQYGASQPAD